VTDLPRPALVRPVALEQIAALVGARNTTHGVPVTGISHRDTAIRAGDLFAAVPGARAHGASFATAAVARGAVAVLTDPAGAAQVPEGVPVLVVPDVRAVLGAVSAFVYGNPSRELTVIGVTGTSGKTTSTYFIRAALAAQGVTSGLIGTVATMIGKDELHTGFTTPEAPDIQALLALMLERGASVVAAEVSSHALALGRADGIEFAVGAFTNLSQDHLDLHGTLDEYFAAKARLFDGRSHKQIIAVDDDWGQRMAAIAGEDAVTVSATGVGADWQAVDIVAGADGHTSFRVVTVAGEFDAGCAVPGAYNVQNALIALASLNAIGVPPDAAIPAIATATVPGRMETVTAGQDFLAVVDYSHKPAAVAGAIAALRPLTRGRLIVVLGCGGDRDRAKRPLMGEIAAREADVLIVTDDNPRSEDPATIRAAMLEGAMHVADEFRGEVHEVGDRAQAIEAAVAMARAGDSVLVAGKGHETGQEVHGVVTPFDDREVLRRALGRGA
jgi:UDP-N-acetylmuramoyl-L-alanyl-D-glutamate--2,6-diaminopimelate ligase